MLPVTYATKERTHPGKQTAFVPGICRRSGATILLRETRVSA
jgi:hypothetical protein